MINILEGLAQMARTRPEALKNEKQRGVKIVGYTGRFVPEELIYASGALPFLICRGGEPEPPEATLPYMIHVINPFSRGQIGYHLLGSDPVVPILDLIIAQCSDCHETRLADLFEYFHFPTVRLGVPADWQKSIAVDYYFRGLARLKERLEALTGTGISDERLRDSINSINKIRDLLEKIRVLRKRQPPPIGGYDFIRLNHYSYYIEPETLISHLADLYEYLKESQAPFPAEAPRILLAGRVIGVGDYVVPRLVETSGGVIVSELLDEGIRHCSWQVPAEGNLMENLGKTYYLDRTPPSIFQPAWGQRVDAMKQLIRDFRIDGVLWYQLSFEEIYDMEYAIVAKAMQEMKVPTMKLDSSYEYSRESMGPLVTRIESFVHSIKQRRS
jgi:benzoyl-CoA reductase/2-hydroxyglutaryl-CoA dehydratase subunit BcrC/BadD/HgdB